MDAIFKLTCEERRKRSRLHEVSMARYVWIYSFLRSKFIITLFRAVEVPVKFCSCFESLVESVLGEYWV